MPALLIKDMPQEVHEWLKAEAERNRRSMTQQAIVIFEERMYRFQPLRFPPPTRTKTPLTARFIDQAKREGRLWQAVSGKDKEAMMSGSTLLDKTFKVIMKHFVETGQAPFYTEIGAALGLTVEEGRKALHNLFKAGIPGWLFPGTDYITSFAPFNHLPTQYRITIDGQQKWYGQWGFESLAVCWLFPGKKVRIDAPCLDCGKPVAVEMQDGKVLRAEPKEITGYVAVPFGKWFENIPYAWSTMNLFRSEEHVRNWSGFKPDTDEGIIALGDLVALFSGNYFRRRLDDDWVSHSRGYAIELGKEFGKRGPFWQLPRK